MGQQADQAAPHLEAKLRVFTHALVDGMSHVTQLADCPATAVPADRVAQLSRLAAMADSVGPFVVVIQMVMGGPAV